MEMLAAGIGVWAMGSLLLAVLWMASARGSARTTPSFRPPVFVSIPRPQHIDLTDGAAGETTPPQVPQAAQ